MTEQEINIAIAEHFGFSFFRNKDGAGRRIVGVPQWTKCLNEMHSVEVEHIIPNGLWDEYVSAIKKSMRDGERFWGQAAARHRAEAFLRTLGLWED